MTTINSTYMRMAQDYLAIKVRTPHYEIRSISEVTPVDGWLNLQSFSDEEMRQLLALRDKYGKEDFYNHLDEIFDEDTIHDMIYGSEIISFDLDNEYYMYTFTCHEITDEGVRTRKIKINLTDETYARLLAAHLDDEDLTINSLRYHNKDLYELLVNCIDCKFCYEGIYEVYNPYTVTMDEVRADAQKIREQHPDKFTEKSGKVGYFI